MTPHEHAKRALAGQFLLLTALLWEEESSGLLPDDLYQWAHQAEQEPNTNGGKEKGAMRS